MSTETSSVAIEAELEGLFGAYVSAGQSPGLVFGIISAEGLTHSYGFGRANDASVVPTADTPFPIASISKSFTATAVLIARDRGLIALDALISSYLPEFHASGAPEDPCDPPTIRMLLSMSGGFTEDNSWVDAQIGMTEGQFLTRVSNGINYSHTPGTTYEYSNIGFALVGLALERVTGMPIDEFITQEILQPLKMRSTGFRVSDSDPGVRASGYSRVADEWAVFPIAEAGVFAAAAGMISTVRDLSIWATWLGNAFRTSPIGADEILRRSSRRELQRIESVIPPLVSPQATGALHVSLGGYGLGLHIEHDLFHGVVVSHSGGLPGYKLHVCWQPESGRGIVVFTNSHRGDPGSLAQEALQRILAAHQTPAKTIVLWKTTVAARVATEELIRSWTAERADQLFAANVDFDRPLSERRSEVDACVDAIGPLGEPQPSAIVVSAATPADVTWSIPGERGELLCMIHLDALNPPRVQEFVIEAFPHGVPRSAVPFDISPRRSELRDASLGAQRNSRVILPTAK